MSSTQPRYRTTPSPKRSRPGPRAHRPVRRGGEVGDKRFGVAEVVGSVDQPHLVASTSKARCLKTSSRAVECEEWLTVPPPGSALARSYCGCDGRYGWHPTSEGWPLRLRDPLRRGIAVLHPNSQRLGAFQQYPGVERAHRRTGVAPQLYTGPSMLSLKYGRPALTLTVDVANLSTSTPSGRSCSSRWQIRCPAPLLHPRHVPTQVPRSDIHQRPGIGRRLENTAAWVPAPLHARGRHRRLGRCCTPAPAGSRCTPRNTSQTGCARLPVGLRPAARPAR